MVDKFTAREQELMKNYKNLNEPVNPDSPMGQLEQMAVGAKPALKNSPSLRDPVDFLYHSYYTENKPRIYI
jgi:hypothetical protein